MGQFLRGTPGRGIQRFLRSRFYTIRQINEKYSKPRLKPTRLIRISLYALRIYLLALVGILIYKFITLVAK